MTTPVAPDGSTPDSESSSPDQSAHVGEPAEPDVVIHDALVLTVDDDDRLYERGTVVVDDGQIVAVRPSREDDSDANADWTVDGSGKLVMPGLVNTHTHLELTPTIGAFSDLDLTELTTTMTALFSDFAAGDHAEFAAAAFELAALNFLRGGVTTVNSMDARPSAGVEAFAESGLRGFFGVGLSDMFLDIPVDEQFERARQFVDTYHNSYDGRIRATVCPHDDWSCTRELCERTAALADDYPELLVHTHLLELAQSNTVARSNGSDDSLELLRMLTIEGARALGVGDEIGSIEPGKRADLLVLDVDTPKFTPLTNVPAHVVGHASPADVETVVVDGNVLLHEGVVQTLDPDAVRERAEAALRRFASETDWEFSLAAGTPPSAVSVARDLPKRGPAHMLSRLAVQSVKDTLPL